MLNGYKSYVAALGMFCLGIYQLTIGQYAEAIQSFMAALAVFGVRNAMARNGM